jgi:hypothetical protein
LIGGCPGSIQLFANGWPVSSTIMTIMYIGHYMLMSRI